MSKSRRFEITYSVITPELEHPPERVDFWLPFPEPSADQELCAVDVETALPYQIKYDAVYGNPVLHAVASRAHATPYEIVIRAHAIRHERSVSLRQCCDEPPVGTSSPFKAQLAETRLIRFSPEILTIADAITQKHTGSVAIAKAAYDHVLNHITYDKSGDGWGTGSADYACSIGKGNCTDIHSLFLAIIRACGVPGEFEIGVAFPAGMRAGDLTAYKCGYHCWTSFYAPGLGWVPVDCSEAAQKPELRDYYFGSIDEDRFLLSHGRDIELPSRMSSDPVNFLTEPVIECGEGKPLRYTKLLSFRGL